MQNFNDDSIDMFMQSTYFGCFLNNQTLFCRGVWLMAQIQA